MSDDTVLADLDVVTQADILRFEGKGQLSRDVPSIGKRRLINVEGVTLGFTRDTNPDIIGFDVYEMMASHPAIRSALVLLKAPIIGRAKQAQVVCDDEKVKAVVERVFLESGLLVRTMRTMLRALEYGVSFHEIDWEAEELTVPFMETLEDGTQQEGTAWDGPIHSIKTIKEVNPTTVSEILRRTKPRDGKPGDGSYDGFVQTDPKGLSKFTRSDGTTGTGIHIEPLKSFVYSHDMRFGNMWGTPRTRPAYPFYFWAQAQWKYWMAWGEKKQASTRLVRFPEGWTTLPDGSRIENMVLALNVGNALDSVATVALPSTRNPVSGEYDWDIEEFTTTDRSDTFEKITSALDQQALMAIFMPERVFREGEHGTLAEAETHTDTFLLTLDETKDDAVDTFNRFSVQRFVAVNFGPDVECRIDVPSLTDQQRANVRAAFNMLITNPENQSQIDFRAIAEDQGLPLLEEQPDEEEVPEEEPLEEEEVPVEEDLEDELPPEEGGTPDNLVLSDEDTDSVEWFSGLTILGDVVSLALPVDLSKYEISPDGKSTIGYKIINKSTGKRVLGSAARNVLKAFKSQGAKASKKAESEAKAAARKQESAAKSAQTKAQQEQRRAAAEAKSAARTAASAQAKAKAAGERAQKQQTAETRRVAAETKREADRATRAAETAQRKAEQEKAKAEREQKAQTREQERTTAKQTREAKQAAKETEKADKAVAGAVAKETKELQTATVAEKNALERAVAKEKDPNKALNKVKSEGWQPGGTAGSRDAALAQAERLAKDSPDKMVSVMKVGERFVVISKPKKAIKTSKNTASNVAAADVSEEPVGSPPGYDDPGHDSSSPTEEVLGVFQRAQETITGFFTRHGEDPADDEWSEETEDSDGETETA